MDKKLAFSDTFNQTLLGLIIGWGGFSAIIPNALEGLSDIVELGSFRALRVFSITYFLLPIFLFLIYWQLRGSKLTAKYLCKEKAIYSRGHLTITIVGALLTLLPVILFINDQFFLGYINEKILWGILSIKSYHLLVLYTILACTHHLYSSIYLIKYQREKGNDATFESISFLVSSLFLVFGVGVVSLIEPWVMYMGSINAWILVCTVIFLLFALVQYLFIDKQDRQISFFKRFAFSSFLVLFIMSCYPNFNLESKSYVFVYAIYAVILFGAPFVRSRLKGDDNTDLKSMLFFGGELMVLVVVFSFIQLNFVSVILSETNKAYFNTRLQAADHVSKEKLFPLFHLGEKNESLVDGLTSEEYGAFSRKIFDNNHKLVNFLKKRSQDSTDLHFKTASGDTIWLTELSRNHWNSTSVRSFFYREYLKQSKNSNTAALVNDRDKLGEFYAQQYRFIEDVIINKYLKKSKDLNIDSIEYYFHPINYYTKTLKHYRNQQSAASSLLALRNEYGWVDSLATATGSENFKIKKGHIKKKILKGLCKIPELNSAPFIDSIEVVENKVAVTYYPGVEMLLGTLKSSKKGLLPYVLYLKSQQYVERFERAQHIFKAYLQDAQRLGLFILLAVLTFILLMYWILHRPGYEKEEKHEVDDLPGGYLNISILIFVILFVHMARPIKAENINPEQPHWMMNLDNWYQKDAIRKFFGAEDEAKKTINNYNTGLKKEDLYELERGINRSIDILDEIKKGQ